MVMRYPAAEGGKNGIHYFNIDCGNSGDSNFKNKIMFISINVIASYLDVLTPMNGISTLTK
jgi:hypothetical protein